MTTDFSFFWSELFKGDDECQTSCFSFELPFIYGAHHTCQRALHLWPALGWERSLSRFQKFPSNESERKQSENSHIRTSSSIFSQNTMNVKYFIKMWTMWCCREHKYLTIFGWERRSKTPISVLTIFLSIWVDDTMNITSNSHSGISRKMKISL